jgi:(R,R)-butanediol dehydrogenase / meso-butanediol dehydrogenase / diacetyl reductase
MGHEFAGTVIEVGSKVQNIATGQKVAVNPALDHRHHGMEPCAPCRAGKYNVCGATATYGLSAPGGGFSAEIVVNAINCLPVPDNVSLKVAALVEPLAVAWHCIEISGFKEGEDVLILGAGPIGLAILLLLRVRGANKIIVTEVAEKRIEQAKRFGADVVVNPMKKVAVEGQLHADPALDAISKMTEDGVDVAFDATGLQSTLDLAIASVRTGGTIFNVAIHEEPKLLDLNALARKEKKLMGGICYTNKDFKAIIDLLAENKLNAEQMITSIVPLSNIVDGGFRELINNKAEHVKILIQPDA